MNKRVLWGAVSFLVMCTVLLASDVASYRLLSVSDSEKLILVSAVSGKKKFLLDASSAKITVNGKAAEFRELKVFSVLRLKMDQKKSSRNGIKIDGIAMEIRISDPDEQK